MSLLFSIAIYCAVFASSSLLFPEKNTNRKYWLCGLVASLIIPSAIAGVRALSVGKDIYTYAIYVFSFFGLSGVNVGSIFTSASPLFALLALISGRMSSNIHLFLFLIEVLVLLPVYYIYGVEVEKNRKFSILLFLLMFFNYSLNIMRQSISAGFVFVAFYLFKKKNYFFSLIIAAVAYGFHNTALIYLLILLFFVLFDRLLSAKKAALMNVFYIVLIEIVLFSFLISFTNILLKLGVINEVIYNRYYTILLGRDIPFSRLMIFELVFRGVLIIYMVICYFASNKNAYDRENNIIAYLSLFGLITYCMAVLFLHTSVAYRFTQNFDYFIPIYLAEKTDNFKIQIGRNQSKVILVAWFFLHWIIAYILVPSGMGFGTEYYGFEI